LPETALHVTSRRLTTRPSTAPLTSAVVWAREVLRGVMNSPSINGKDGVAGRRRGPQQFVRALDIASRLAAANGACRRNGRFCDTSLYRSPPTPQDMSGTSAASTSQQLAPSQSSAAPARRCEGARRPAAGRVIGRARLAGHRAAGGTHLGERPSRRPDRPADDRCAWPLHRA
jgi:hypothetical protein